MSTRLEEQGSIAESDDDPGCGEWCGNDCPECAGWTVYHRCTDACRAACAKAYESDDPIDDHGWGDLGAPIIDDRSAD